MSNRYQFLEYAGTPTPRHGFGMAYSPTLDQVVIQAGQTNSMSQPEVHTHETWAFDRHAGVWVSVEANDELLGDRSYHDLASSTCGEKSVVLFDQPSREALQTPNLPPQPTWVMK